MVTVLPSFDPGRDIGKSLGSGFGEALKFLGERKMQQGALDELKGMNLDEMSPIDIAHGVMRATAGSPQMQRSAPDIIRTLMDQKRASAAQQSYRNQARGLNDIDDVPEPRQSTDKFMDQFPKFGQTTNGQQELGKEGLQTPKDMRRVPELEDTTGRESLLSPQEVDEAGGPFFAVGDYAGGQKAIERAKDQKLKQRELQIEAQKERNRVLQQQRALESEIAKNVLEKTDELLESKGLDGGEQWKRLGYNYFEEERKNKDNEKKSDQELWNSAGAKLERKINDLGDATTKVVRPTFRGNQERRAEGAKKWVQGHLKEYGDSPEDTELMNTILVSQGWSMPEAHAMTRPLSDKAQQAFKNIPKLQQAETFGSLPGFEQAKDLDTKNFDKTKNQIAPKLAENLGDNDSIFLLKNSLVRDKNFTDEQAIEIIDEVRKYKDFSDVQIRDLGYIPQNSRPSLVDLFLSDRKFTELMEPLIR